MKGVLAVLKVINIVNEKIAKVACYCIVLLIITLCYEVIVRYLFGKPTQWSFDATYFLSSIAIAFTFAYTWQLNGHVNVDIFSAKLPVRAQALINVIFMLSLFFLCWLSIIWVMVPHTIESWRIWERATIGFLPPIYPYKTWILIGVIMLVMQGVVVFIKELYRLIKGKELQIS